MPTFSTSRKFLFVLLLLISAALTFSTKAYAQYNPSFETANDANFHTSIPADLAEKISGCKYQTEFGQMNSIIGNLLGIVGGATTTQLTCIADNADAIPAAQIREFFDKSQVALRPMILNTTFSIVDQRPASGIVFAMEQSQRLVSPDTVYAQSQSGAPTPYFPGTGYDLLRPIQSFWGWAVTVSYSFMIFIIIIVAFAMMFRARLDGQTVVQIQNAIPGIVMAMILIPLSYPICGLFIDGITLSTNIIHDVFFSGSGLAGSGFEDADGTPVSEGRGLYADDPGVGVLNVGGLIRVSQLSEVNVNCDTGGVGEEICEFTEGSAGIVMDIVTFLYNLFTGNFFDSTKGSTPPADMVGMLLQLLFEIIAIVVGFRILFRLLKKFLVLMLYPIFSPFVFATMAVPGQGTKTVLNFLKRMGAAALYYIATYGLFLVVIVFSSSNFYSTIPGLENYNYTPPLISPVFSSFLNQNVGTDAEGQEQANTISSAKLIFTLFAIGVFVSIPRILDGIGTALGVDDAIPEILKTPFRELAYSADVGFRQAPAVGLSVARSGLRGAGGVRQSFENVGDAFRAPGSPTAAQLRQQRGVTWASGAQARLTDALAGGNPLKIAAAYGALGVTRGANAVLGQAPPTSEETQKISTHFELKNKTDIGKSLRVTEDLKLQRSIKLSLIIESSVYPIPQKDIVFGPVNITTMTFSGKTDTMGPGKVLLNSFQDSGKGSPKGTIELKVVKKPDIYPNSKKVTVECELAFSDVPDKVLTVGETYSNEGSIMLRIGGASSDAINLNISFTRGF